MCIVVARRSGATSRSTVFAALKTGCLGLLLVAPTSPLTAQQESSSEMPAVFSLLEGSWEGTGVLLGRPAAFHLAWEVGSGGFVHLSFSNIWVQDSGEVIPVLSAEATYFVDDRSAVGVWLDDRPQRLFLDAIISDSSVVTRWSGEVEGGRTEYLVRSATTLIVRDFVLSDGTERLFAEATYHRIPRSR